MLKHLLRTPLAVFERCLPSTLFAQLPLGNPNFHGKNNEDKRKWYWSYSYSVKMPLLGLSILVTIKDLLGIDRVRLDDDPLKAKVKKAWMLRKHRKYVEAVDILHDALKNALDLKEEIVISRIYDELANTYYEMSSLDEAETMFRTLIQRLMKLHEKREKDPEFIMISLKLADIFAQKGLLENAEAGYMHCVTKQMQVMEEHLKKFIISRGALVEDRYLVETHGSTYTDPVALMGMCLENYAHFLVMYRDESRLNESEEYMNEVLKISYQIYGSNSFHLINILNNYGAALIIKNRFDLALKFLSIGIDRILNIDECSFILPGYYCNYAEALFHCGRQNEALTYARKAVEFSRSEDIKVRNYAEKFLKQLEDDMKRQKRKIVK